MLKHFDSFSLNKPIDHAINTLIMTQASDTAEKLTELDCKLNRIECYEDVIEDGIDIRRFTEEAQDIFDMYYDSQCEELYALLNAQVIEINKDTINNK